MLSLPPSQRRSRKRLVLLHAKTSAQEDAAMRKLLGEGSTNATGATSSSSLMVPMMP
jgi:hypothetical protein